MRKREGVSPEITIVPRDQGFQALEVNTDMGENGEYISAWRGLNPWRVGENVCTGTWESQGVSRTLLKSGKP